MTATDGTEAVDATADAAVISNEIANAIALPGGKIYVFEGLLAKAENVDELAGWIDEVRGTEVEVVIENQRPVPLVHQLGVPPRGPRGLDAVRQVELRERCRELLPAAPCVLTARAWAVRGTV